MKRSILFSVALSLVACGETPAPPQKAPTPPVKTTPKEMSGPPTPGTQAAVDLRKLPDTEAKNPLSLDQWKLVSDPSQKETLYGIAYGNGTYVAIGNGETILASTDSIVWERQTIEKLDGAQQIAFGAGKFILRSRSATYQSTDGKAWAEVEKAPRDGVYLDFVNNEFTQVSFGNRFYTSKDGLAWVENVAEGLREGLSTYGAGVYVMADFYKETEDGKEQLYSFTSPDGKAWAQQASDAGSGMVTGLLYAKELFLLVQGDGQLLTSADGKAWSKGERLQGKGVFGHPVFCNDRFLLIAGAANVGANVFSSPDAKTWTKHAFDFPKGVNGLVCGDGVVVAVGIDGAIFIAKL